jgi:hypothetical protein
LWITAGAGRIRTLDAADIEISQGTTLRHVNLDAQTATIVALVGIIVGVVGIAIGVIALSKLSRLHRSYSLLRVDEGKETLLDVLSRTREEFAELSDDVKGIDYSLSQLQRGLSIALRHVAVTRYDALDNMGGRYSFSAALVDDYGDGLVITSIHGRSETRSYLKSIVGGVSEIDLSPEEKNAVAAALRGGA